MTKIAYIVSFEPKTRVVIDVYKDPKCLTDKEREELMNKAIENIRKDIEGYLNMDSMDWRIDIEIPYDPQIDD